MPIGYRKDSEVVYVLPNPYVIEDWMFEKIPSRYEVTEEISQLKNKTMPIKKVTTKTAAKPAVKAVKKGKPITLKPTKSAKKK